MRVDAISLSSFVDNFGSSLTFADSGTVAKSFPGKADKMTVVRFPTPMPREVGVSLFESKVEIIVGVFTRVFAGEEVLDVGDAHASIIGHGGVANDVAGLETVKHGGRR